MKIVFIVDYYYPAIGGAETLYQHLAEGLVRNHQVVVLTQGKRGDALYEVINGVKVFRVRTWHRAIFPYQAFSLAKKLVKDADIIQTATYSSGILVARLRSFTKAKIVCIVHEYLDRRWLQFGLYGLQAYLYEKYFFRNTFDHYVAVSDSGKKQLLSAGIAESKITRIYNGIDYDLFKPREKNVHLRHSLGMGDTAFVCLFAGRPVVQKGIYLLLNAIRNSEFRILDDKVKMVFMLSKKPYLQYLRVKQFIKRYHLQDKVRILDSVARNELPQYMAMADAIIVPSLAEGFGFFAAEVSAMEIPLIATKLDSLPEVVSGKVVLIDRLSPDAIVQALQSAMQGQYAILQKKYFSWSKTIQAYDQLYYMMSH